MRVEQYSPQTLLDLFRRKQIATLRELKAELGTGADATVFRKLRRLDYRTSYSDRGRFYTLAGIPQYDEWGLWSYRSVWFSQRGTLLSTAEHLVEHAEVGFYEAELATLLHVEVRGALLQLVREGRLGRESLGGRYLYGSAQVSKRRSQVSARRMQEAETLPTEGLPHLDVIPDELKAAIVLFFSVLDEKQRRLYAGLESLKMGHGGDQTIADLLGLDASTVSRGRRELLRRDVDVERVRRKGGGRKRVEKKRLR